MKALKNIFGLGCGLLLLGAYMLPWISQGALLNGVSGLQLTSGDLAVLQVPWSFGGDLWLMVFPVLGGVVLASLAYSHLPYQRVPTAFGIILLTCTAAVGTFIVLRSGAILNQLNASLTLLDGARILFQGFELSNGSVFRAGIGLYLMLIALVCGVLGGIFSLAAGVRPVPAPVEQMTNPKGSDLVELISIPTPTHQTPKGPFPDLEQSRADPRADTIRDIVELPQNKRSDPNAYPETLADQVQGDHQPAEKITSFAWLVAVEGDSLPVGSAFTISTIKRLSAGPLKTCLSLTMVRSLADMRRSSGKQVSFHFLILKAGMAPLFTMVLLQIGNRLTNMSLKMEIG